MDRWWKKIPEGYYYNVGYQDCIKDITEMLHRERTELEGHGDPMAIWWGKYWTLRDKIHQLWQRRFSDEEASSRN